MARWTAVLAGPQNSSYMILMQTNLKFWIICRILMQPRALVYSPRKQWSGQVQNAWLPVIVDQRLSEYSPLPKLRFITLKLLRSLRAWICIARENSLKLDLLMSKATGYELDRLGL